METIFVLIYKNIFLHKYIFKNYLFVFLFSSGSLTYKKVANYFKYKDIAGLILFVQEFLPPPQITRLVQGGPVGTLVCPADPEWSERLDACENAFERVFHTGFIGLDNALTDLYGWYCQCVSLVKALAHAKAEMY